MLLCRKIFFYIFCLIYLILTPLIIARMLGFAANPLTHRFVKTGLVFVSTNPPDATVFMDGRMIHGGTPVVVRDLTPGKHFIRLQLDGYRDWEKSIPIVGKKATVLDNTLLIPEQWPIQRISHKPYQNLIAPTAGILVGTNPILKSIDIFRTDDKDNPQALPLFLENSIYAEGRLVRVFHADQSPFILLETILHDKQKFLWVSLKEKPPLIEDITDLFGQIPDHITWRSPDDKNIFAFYPNTIYRINIKTKTIYPLTPSAQPADALPVVPSGRIQQSFLINAKNDLLIREGPWIRIYPKADFGVPDSYIITRSRALTNMYFEEKNGKLFYLDDDNLFLYTVEILHNHPLLNIAVPEKLRIKTP